MTAEFPVRVACAAILWLSVAACGLKGDLYLPEQGSEQPAPAELPEEESEDTPQDEIVE